MKFNVIVADPPWEFSDKYGPRGCNKKYDTLTFEDLMELKVRKIAADDSVLALWVPWALIVRGFILIHKWGFVLKTAWVWGKTTREGNIAMGCGRIFRAATEVCLIGKRGRPTIRKRDRRSLYLGPRHEHSAKPERLQDDLEAMVHGPRLELFARRKRKHWTCVGIELNGEDVRKSIRRLRRLPEPE